MTEQLNIGEIYKVKIKGTKPFLMHSPRGRISDKPKLRRGEHPNPKVEAEAGLYKDIEGKICVPATNIKACIRDAGRNYKVSGRRSTFASMIRAALEISPSMVPLVHDKPWVVDQQQVVVQRSRIIRARPRFDSWALKFELKNSDPDVIHQDTLKKILVDAGKYYGLGDFRPEFGLFELEEFNVESS